MRIYLSTDTACWTLPKLKLHALGGAENFFLILSRWLIEAGHDVFDPVLNPTAEGVDLTICSNNAVFPVKTKKRLLWSGSWHSPVDEPSFDEIIIISEFMKAEMKCDRAVVLPVPYGKDIDKFTGCDFINGRIVTTSNPNRWYSNAGELTALFKERGLSYEWRFAGGNQLYSQKYPECFSFGGDGLIYDGILGRHDLLGLLITAHVWIYPNFQDASETFCLSMIEAAALNIPVILPNREPFSSVLPEAFFVNSPKEMADLVVKLMTQGYNRVNYDVSRYKEENVMPKYLELIERLTG
jgi:hypothetical protein